MKLLNVFIFTFIISSCNAQSDLNTMIISYDAITRGSSINLEASSTQIHYKDKQTTKEIKPTPEYWNELGLLVQEINLSDLESFVAPSENSLVDAALQATLRIKMGNKIYQSQVFDHGNPPIEIKPLIDKLFSILEDQ